jgi:aldehyde dehydrogenase (NAD+)
VSDLNLPDPKLDWASEWLKQPKGHYVNSLPEAGESEVERAVGSARAAHDSGEWAQLDRRERMRILHQMAAIVREHRTELATL